MQLERLKTTEVAALPRDTVVVLPLASIEQHGPHLPLGTDSMIAEGVAGALDAACNGRLLVAPVLRFGCSEHHMAFAGSLTLSHESFKTTVMDLVDSLHRHGFRRLVLLNAHGGNRSVGGVIAEKAASRWPDARVVLASWFQVAAPALAPLVEGEYPSVGHAGEFETSVMLVLHPDLVDMSEAVDDGPAHLQPPFRNDLLSGGQAALAEPFDRLTHHGVWGRPTLASEQKGRRILEVTTAELVKMLEVAWPGCSGAQEGRP